MIYNEINLAVAKIADKHGHRPELRGVFFTNNRTVATDGFRLLEIYTPQDKNPENYPAVHGHSAMRGIKPFIVDAEVLKAKVKAGINGLAIKHVFDNRVEFLNTDGATADITVVPRIQADYPKYEDIYPKGEPKAEITINGQYLIDLLAVLSKLDKNKAVKLKFYGESKPLLLEAENGATQEGYAMLMPIQP